ncbi:transposase [Nocardia asiatica]|uniref:transposase n=1 Tax=Nocardia asiatica TaxID=209252 RepID=UPI003EE07BEB
MRSHLAEIYGAVVSRETISKITDAVAGELGYGRSRPLDRVYAVVMIDCLVKIRDGQLSSRPVYVAVGIGLDRACNVLGLWVGDGGEGAEHWMVVVAALRNPGAANVCGCVPPQYASTADTGSLPLSQLCLPTTRRGVPSDLGSGRLAVLIVLVLSDHGEEFANPRRPLLTGPGRGDVAFDQ